MKTTIQLAVYAAMDVGTICSASLLSRIMNNTAVPTESMRKTDYTVNYVALPSSAKPLSEALATERRRP